MQPSRSSHARTNQGVKKPIIKREIVSNTFEIELSIDRGNYRGSLLLDSEQFHHRRANLLRLPLCFWVAQRGDWHHFILDVNDNVHFAYKSLINYDISKKISDNVGSVY